MNCEQCREQIWPYLYGLLEPVEHEQMAVHVEQCAGCRDALNAALEQTGMLAEAVKPENATIVFKAPIKATPASTAPTLVFDPAPRSRRIVFLNRWTMAASLLAFLFSIGAVIGGAAWREHADSHAEANARFAKAKDDLDKAQKDLDKVKDRTQTEIRAIQEQIDEIFNQWKKADTKTRVLAKDQVQYFLNGPRVLQSGARNNIEIQMSQESFNNYQQIPNVKSQLSKQNPQLPGMPQLNAKLFNQKTQEVLLEQKLQLNQNRATNFDIPPDLPIKPGDQLALELQTQDLEGNTVAVSENLNLAFPEYVTHLTTDRPMYRPGETVRFRSLTLERFSLKPAQQNFHLRYRIVGPQNREVYANEVSGQVISDKGNIPIKGPDGKVLQGLGVGEYVLPNELPEGVYALSVNEANELFNEEKRTFQVRRWLAPRFNKEVTFHRSSYGPNDVVRMVVRVSLLAGQRPMNNVQVTATIKVDGRDVNVNAPRGQMFLNDATHMEFEFTLPGDMARGVGVATIICNDGGQPDTTVRTIPIALRNVDVEFFPEGGDLIAGVPNRVYFQGRTPAGKPADFEGVILDERRQEVARIRTMTDDREPGINQGLGSFTFTPIFKKRYSLQIETPIGIQRLFALPTVKDTGVVLHCPQGVVENAIDVTLHNAKTPRELLVGAYCRGRLLDHKFVKAGVNQPIRVTLKSPAPVAGVYRITVFEKLRDANGVSFRPLAERLIYRKSQAHVDVAIENSRPKYQPGESVELQLRATNEKREFVPAIAMVAVIDASVNRLVDDKTERSMPTHFLLTTEVRNPEDLENADVFLGNHAQASAALDLLLGCQGWRRFAEQDPKKFAQTQQVGRTPIFVRNAVNEPQILETEQKQINKLDQAFVTKAIEGNKRLAVKERDENGPPEMVQDVQRLQGIVDATSNEQFMAAGRVREIQMFFWQFGLGGALLTLLFVGFFLISIGLRRLSEGGNARPWIIFGLSLFGLLFLVSIVGTFTLMGDSFFEELHNDLRGMKMLPPQNVAVNQLWMGEGPPAMPEVEPFVIEDIDPAANIEKAQLEPRLMPAQNERNQRVWANLFDVGQPPMPNAPVEIDERALRQQGNYQLLLERQIGRRVQLPPAHDPCVVREYAHQHQPGKDAVRRDFAETVYWHPVLVMADGKAQVKFDLADSVTRYEVLVLSNTFDGRLGANRAEIVAALPFTVEPRTPLEVSQNDQFIIPVALTNSSTNDVTALLSVRGKGLNLEGQAERTVPLKANEAKRELYRATPSIVEGDAAFRVVGKSAGVGDGVERKFKVVADGFPGGGSVSGVLDNGAVEHLIELPTQWIDGSLQVHAHFYPSPLAELQSGLDALLREPAGCFEQSSSSNYPNVLILHHLKHASTLGHANPLAEKRARQLLLTGYAKLTAFESADPKNQQTKRGYEWFGAYPPHEALTAYGLLQFRDMAKVHRVDDAMLKRTEQYLLDQRDGKGGFQRNPQGLDRFGRAPDAITNAYILWALSESGGSENLDVELTALRDQAKTRKDPYFLALAALSHLNRQKTQHGIDLLRQVRNFQIADGQVKGAETSITGSHGRDLAVETTALAILGWLKAERPADFNPNLQNALRWLGQQRRGEGSYGGTQATILALKASLAHAQKNVRQLQAGEVQMALRNGRAGEAPPVGPGGQDFFDASRAAFTARMQDPISIKLQDAAIPVPGKNLVSLNITGGSAMPYTLTWSYRTLKPANDPQAPVKLATTLSANRVKEGDSVKLKAMLENVSGKGHGMTLAVLGLPAGLSLPEDASQLKALSALQENGTKPGKIAAWELRGRELVLYWRDLAPEAKIEVELDLICRIPGFFQGPASRAYLYYDSDRKFWADPLTIRIVEIK